MTLSPEAPDCAQDCYTMAYFVLPRYVASDGPTFIEKPAYSPTLGAGFYYVLACQRNGKEPGGELLRSFPVHLGDLDEANRYCVVEHPTPRRSWSSLEEMIELGDEVVLAPYFSATILNGPSAVTRYFVLGQSRMAVRPCGR